MKQKVIIIVGSFIFFGISVFYQSQPQLVTGRKAELQKIVITAYEITGNEASDIINSITTIEDQQTMYYIYNKLQNSRPIKGNYEETEYTMLTPHYKIVLYYLDSEDNIAVYTHSSGRYLGKPDIFTVSKTTKIEKMIETILNQ